MSDKITFGPDADQWVYDRSTKTYDLTRGNSTNTYTVETTQGPPGTSIALDTDKTALVVVDMQNAFLHDKIRDHPTGLKTVEPTLSLISKCRKLGIQVRDIYILI